jgi:UPF0755 protein
MDDNTSPEALPLEAHDDDITANQQLLAEPKRTEKGTILFTKDSPTVIPTRHWWRVLASTFIVLSLVFLGTLSYLRQQLTALSGISVPKEFEIQPGWGASRVASELEASGIIRNGRIFSLYLRQQKLDRSIGEGLYDLNPNMSAATVASVLSQGGRPRIAKVIIPEGFRMKDIAKTLSEAGFADEQTFLNLFQNPGELSPEFSQDGLEGYLFPASYEFPIKSTTKDILEAFLNRFEQEITPEVKTYLAENGWTISQWVTLASIIQAEAANPSEMPIIAGVFLNRLDEGMALQSDPTVAYGLNKDLPDLSYPEGDFEQDHPWNTYLYPGFPLTPINNPGHDALQAVVNPQRTNEENQPYFYFLHGTDEGQPVFRPNLTLDDHNRDVAQYLSR